jgi:hypothetical protein
MSWEKKKKKLINWVQLGAHSVTNYIMIINNNNNNNNIFLK